MNRARLVLSHRELAEVLDLNAGITVVAVLDDQTSDAVTFVLNGVDVPRAPELVLLPAVDLCDVS